MTKLKNRAIIIIISCIAALLLCIGISLTKVNAELSLAFVDVEIADTYTRGTVLEIPQGEFTSGENVYEATHQVLFPDNRTSAANRVKLDVVGQYTIIYSAVGGEGTEEIKFSVVNSNNALFSTVKGEGETILDVVYDNAAYVGTQIVASESNTIISYKEIIDLNNLSADTPIIDFMITPTMTGSMEIAVFDVTLTDLHDENNSVSIRLLGHNDRDRSYVVASANGNEFLGVTTQEQGAIPWGVPIAHTFYGEPVGNQYYSVKYYFDVKTAQIYVSPWLGTGHGKVLVLDLDEPNTYVDANHIFKGFTSNEIRISLKFSSLTASKGNITIGSIAETSFAQDALKDRTAPVLKVDFGEYIYNEADADKSTLPYGVVGKSYKLFDAYAYDNTDGLLEGIDVEVYDFNGQRQRIIDNGFVPMAAGKYTIVYHATDSSNNTSFKRITVEIENFYREEMTIDADFYYNGAVKELSSLVAIPGIRAIGGSGGAKCAVSVWLDGAEIELKGETNAQYFILERAGTYTIRYELTDYLGEPVYVEDYIQAQVFTDVRMNIQTVYPKYQVGMIYPLPRAEVLSCKENGLSREFIVATVENVQMIGDKEFTATQEGEITFEFAYGNKVEKVSANVIDVSNLTGAYLTRYFTTENTELTAQNLGIDITTDKTENGFAFINSLLADALSFKFIGNPDKHSFDAITFIVRDSLYEKETLEIGFRLTGLDYVELVVNGKTQAKIFQKLDGVDLFEISVKNGKVYIGTEAMAQIETYLNGEIFQGFSSGEVLLSGHFDGVTGGSEIQLRTIVNHNTTNASRDRVAPYVLIDAQYTPSSYKFLGEELVIHPAKAMDVLKGKFSVSVSITKPDGSVISYNNADESRSIIADMYGDYRIVYEAKDGTQVGSADYTYKVRDIISPTITLDKDNPSIIKAGTTIKLAQAQANDDSGKNCEVYCYIIAADGRRIIVQNGGEYTFAECGNYRVVYYTNDDYYNLAELSCYITVR